MAASFATSEAIAIVNELMVDLSPPVEEEVKYEEYKTDWKKLEPREMATFIKEYLNGEHKKELFQIFDVRDAMTDYRGGHIVTALNVPINDFCDNLHTLFESYYKCKVIFIHCMYSQQRGPKAASWYRNALEEIVNNFQNPKIEKAQYSGHFEKLHELVVTEEMVKCLMEQKIFVLKGGFNYFLNSYHEDYPELFEDFEQKYWSIEADGHLYSGRSKLVHIHDM